MKVLLFSKKIEGDSLLPSLLFIRNLLAQNCLKSRPKCAQHILYGEVKVCKLYLHNNNNIQGFWRNGLYGFILQVSHYKLGLPVVHRVHFVMLQALAFSRYRF